MRWLQRWLIGGIVALGALLVVFLAARRGGLPTLTRAAFAAAEERWSAEGPADYTIEIEVQGNQPAVYLVEVRDGEPVTATRNGVALTRPRTWATWSVPGMFGTVESDLESLETQRLPLVVRCQFDPQYGYPARYQRIELGGGSQVTWQVVKFQSPP